MNRRDDVAAFYRSRYADPPGAMRDYRIYLDLVEAEPGGRLLDIGAGEGFLLEAAEARGLRAVGTEIVSEAVRLARRRVARAGLVLAAGEQLPFPDHAFDRVACIGTLEHFLDPAAGVREVARTLHPDGRALLVVPNRKFLPWIIRGDAGTEQQEAAELLLDRRGWSTLLHDNGLAVLRVTKEPWHTKPLPGRLRRLALRALHFLLPLDWTYQFAFVCRRA